MEFFSPGDIKCILFSTNQVVAEALRKMRKTNMEDGDGEPN